MDISYGEFIKQIIESEVNDWIYDDDLGLYIFKKIYVFQ